MMPIVMGKVLRHSRDSSSFVVGQAYDEDGDGDGVILEDIDSLPACQASLVRK
jgi:hypothetical protein